MIFSKQAQKTILHNIKRKAKKLKKHLGTTHAKALEILARLHGFAHTHEMIKVWLQNPADARFVAVGALIEKIGLEAYLVDTHALGREYESVFAQLTEVVEK